MAAPAVLRRVQQVERLPDRLLGGVARDVRGPRVPRGDATAGVQEVDRVVHDGVDEERGMPRGRAGLAADGLTPTIHAPQGSRQASVRAVRRTASSGGTSAKRT